MAFSDIVAGKYKMAHRGVVPAAKLPALADALKMKKREKDALLKASKVYLIHTGTKKSAKAKA